MTFEEITQSDKVMLTARDVGQAIGISAERLKAQARREPKLLGFPVTVACDTVRIPRKAFIAWILGSSEQV